jgi:hypothetical protein
LAGQPAGTPLPWPMQFQGRQLDPDRFTGHFRDRSISGEQSHLLASPIPLPDYLNRFYPESQIAVINLPEIKNVTLDNLVIHVR